jgi:arsenate reductase-like glutaredoxin family protein
MTTRTTRRRTTPVTPAPGAEDDVRVRILNSFMSCPHRDTDRVREIHADIREKDPLFYAHLACWYMSKGEIRDHNEVFASMLLTDPYHDNREVGLALFRRHRLPLKAKILGFVRGKKVNIREKTGEKVRSKKGRKMVDKVCNLKKSVGLRMALPKSFRTEVKKYLKWLEENDARFDAVALRSRNDLKSLYAKVRVKPSDRAKAILFEKKIPEDSKLAVFKKISESKSATQIAKLIVEHKIPYTVAVGLVPKITPAVLVAMISNMSPMEVINNMASLEEKGANDNPKVKDILKSKLAQAKKSKNVSTLKSKTAVKTGRIKDEEILKEMDEVADAQVKKNARISVPIGVFVDRSGSMSEAIEVGKNVAALVSGATVSDLYVVAFDNMPMAIEAKGNTLTAWEKAFKPVRPGGSTSMGCALDLLLRKKQLVETIVVITDEGENAKPAFSTVYKRYEKEMGVSPNVVVIKLNDRWNQNTFSNNLKASGIEFDKYTPNGSDYYGLPGLIPLLAKKSKLDLVYEIMDTPLMKRGAFR